MLGYDRNRLLRHSLAAAFVLTVAALFVRQQLGNAEGDPGQVQVRGPVDALNVEVGKAAPDFILEARGTAVPLQLSSYRGRVVVLNFWASWCGPCREEMPAFQRESAEAAGPTDPVVIAVNVLTLDSRQLADEFAADLGITFPVVYDATGEVAEHYRVRGLPSTFFIDPDGVVRRATYGPVFGNILADGIATAEQRRNAS